MYKLLIGYDGSECADAALADLQHAGLPDTLEAVVLGVADVWLPEEEEQATPQLPANVASMIQHARERAHQAVDEAQAQAERAVQQLQVRFPTWQITAESVADSPAWALLKKAEAWQADLIVVGSHGRAALARAWIGSISQTVTTHAHGSVRVGRANTGDRDKAVRLLIGYDGSAHAEGVIEHVAARHWPPGSEARVMVVLDPLIRTRMPSYANALSGNPADFYTDIGELMERMANEAASKLRTAGLRATTTLQHGDPKKVLVAEAEQWHADCVFVGARGLSQFERILLGSVSTAITARAHCTVEIVRR